MVRLKAAVAAAVLAALAGFNSTMVRLKVTVDSPCCGAE